MIELSPTPVSGKSNLIAARFCRILLVLITGASLLAFALSLLYMLMGSGPFWGIWEDSFMLVRYADNLIHGKGLIWNPGGPPTYGLTSVFYAIPVAIVQAILPHQPVLSLALTSFLCGCLFLTLMALLVGPVLRSSRAAQVAFGALVAISFARASVSLAVHFWSGMDTMFDLAMMTVYLLIAQWQGRRNSWTSTTVLGIAGGLMYGVRPDLLIYTFLVPAAITVLGKDRSVKAKGAAALAITAATTSIVLAAAYLYFGSALPLSFYAKGLKLYGDFEYERYQKVPLEQLTDYAGAYCVLLGVIAIDLLQSLEGRKKNPHSPLYIALLGGTCVFFIYYLFFVLQIMQFYSRFYYPALPALLWLSAVATRRLIDRYSDTFRQVFQSGTGWGWAAGLALSGGLLVTYPLMTDVAHVSREARHGFHTWDAMDEYRAYYKDYWFRLDRFAALPPDLTMATTEIGHVASMNPGRVIVDMAGLNEREFAFHPFSSAVMLKKYAPDLIYMPHPGYRAMNRNLRENPEFQKDYEYFPPSSLSPRVGMGIALRRDSKYYEQMRAIVTARQ